MPVIEIDGRAFTRHDRWEMAVLLTAWRSNTTIEEAKIIVNRDFPEPQEQK